jgi:hypothetical protein
MLETLFYKIMQRTESKQRARSGHEEFALKLKRKWIST